MTKCEWFLKCEKESAGQVEHPTIGEGGGPGWVETCQDHIDWLVAAQNPETGAISPTMFVPPLVARNARGLEAKLGLKLLTLN